jgi:hypothetical protein
MSWIVLTDTLLDGWVDCWTFSEDGKLEVPIRFATRALAEAEIEAEIHECDEAVKRGDMEDSYTRDDFDIVESDDPPNIFEEEV